MTAHLTKPVYYYDDNGYKIGPFRKRDIVALAKNGTISPETLITDNNIEIKAKCIPNLTFFAPEYHQSEEIFSMENLNLAINPNMVLNKNNSQVTPTSTNALSNKDITRILCHPMAITIIILLGITALTSTITCYVIVSVAIAFKELGKEIEQLRLQEKPAFNAQKVNFQFPSLETPQELERDVQLPERNAQPMRPANSVPRTYRRIPLEGESMSSDTAQQKPNG